MANKWYFFSVMLFFAILLTLALEQIYVLKSLTAVQAIMLIVLIALEMLYIFDHRRLYYLSLAFFIIVLARSLIVVFISPSVFSVLAPIFGFAGLFVSLEELNLMLLERRAVFIKEKQHHMAASHRKPYPVAAKPEKIKARKTTAYKIKRKPAVSARYSGKLLGDKKTGLVHRHDCVFAKRILKENLDVFGSEREAIKQYKPHRCLLP